MESITPFTAVTTPARSYTKQQWEGQRDMITSVYRDQAKSFQELRAVLAQQRSFYPSEAMLKKKLRLWDLQRNLKECDMKQALRVYYDRASRGKKTVFLVRNRPVTFDDIARYFRRKGVNNLESLASAVPAGASTTDIACHTPEPCESEAEAPELIQGDVFNFATPVQGPGDIGPPPDVIVAVPDPNQVDRALELPSPSQSLDRLLLLGQKYYDSLFENRPQAQRTLHCELQKLEMFFHHIIHGQALLVLDPAKHTNEAFAHFDAGSNMVRGLLACGTLLFLPYICYFLLPPGLESQREVISHLLQFASMMARESAVQLHPLAQSLAVLAELMPSEWPECSNRLLGSLVDRLQQEFDTSAISDHELESVSICPSGQLHTISGFNALDNHKIASIAIAKLAKDIESRRLRGFPSWSDHVTWSEHGTWGVACLVLESVRDP